MRPMILARFVIYSSLLTIWVSSSVLQAGASSSDPKTLEIPSVDTKQIEASNDLKKPVWLSEASVAVKESYDSNVFLTNADKANFPKIANVDSWVTSITPKVAVNFASLVTSDKNDKGVEQLSLSYAPEVVRYFEAATENYEAHRIATQVKGTVDSFSYNFNNQVNVINGNRNTPQYNQVSCWATSAVRERRDQLQEKGDLVLRNDWDQWFVRGVGSATYYDLNTYLYNPAIAQYSGWQNYCDRYDVNGGIDFGYKITPDFAVTLGYRHGHQDQSPFEWSPANTTNDYDRPMAGVEGKPLKWLSIQLQAGPDFHQYDTATTPVGHASELTRFFCDGTISAAITSRDTLSARVKQWQWVSSVGQQSYEDKLFAFTYKHQWFKKLSTAVGYSIQGATYDAPLVRSDWQYIYSLGVQYDVNEYFSITSDYSYTRGENDSDIVNLAPGREYSRHLVAFGLKTAF